MGKASEDVRTTIMKKKYFGFINKGMLLMDARLREEQIPPILEEDERTILKKVPILVRAIVMMALPRSTEQFKNYYKHEKFVGANAIVSIITFGQYFLQGLSLQSESFEQLCLTNDEIDRVFKKRKQKPKLTNLRNLQENQDDRDYLFTLVGENRKSDIL